MKYLPYKTFSRRHCAIGLQIPTARDNPLALSYEFMNTSKQFGIDFFDILIQNAFVVAENVIVFVAKIGGLFESGNGYA